MKKGILGHVFVFLAVLGLNADANLISTSPTTINLLNNSGFEDDFLPYWDVFNANRVDVGGDHGFVAELDGANLQDAVNHFAYLKQSFYMDPSLYTTAHVTFDINVQGFNDTTDIFRSLMRLETDQGVEWKGTYQVTEDTNGWMSFSGWYSVLNLTDVDPNSRINFVLGEFGDPTNPAVAYVDNVKVIVPEPSTIALFGIGLLGLGLTVLRRTQVSMD